MFLLMSNETYKLGFSIYNDLSKHILGRSVHHAIQVFRHFFVTFWLKKHLYGSLLF
ncbi:MAG: hypothetical protein ACJA08_003523 [Cyclobacteriaceae bacterium]|jgi:hypothetical protein